MDPLNREKIHGRMVNFHPSVRDSGFTHLQRRLDPNEARTLFDAARTQGEAHFEDRGGRNFTIRYDRGKGTYDLHER